MTMPAQADPASPPADVVASPQPAPDAPVADDEDVFSFFGDDDAEGTEPSADAQPPAEPAGDEAPAPAPSPFDAITDEELAQHERVLKLVEREAEAKVTAERTRLEQEAAIREAARDRGYARSEEFTRDFHRLISEAARDLDDDGLPQVKQDSVNQYLGPVVRYGADEVMQVLGALMQEDVGADFTPTEEDAARLNLARAQAASTPLNPAMLVRTWLDLRDRARDSATTAATEARIRGEVEREFRQRARDAAAERRARDADTQRRGTTGPTRAGTNGRTPDNVDLSTRLGLARAVSSGAVDMTDEEFQRRYDEIGQS